MDWDEVVEGCAGAERAEAVGTFMLLMNELEFRTYSLLRLAFPGNDNLLLCSHLWSSVENNRRSALIKAVAQERLPPPLAQLVVYAMVCFDRINPTRNTVAHSFIADNLEDGRPAFHKRDREKPGDLARSDASIEDIRRVATSASSLLLFMSALCRVAAAREKGADEPWPRKPELPYILRTLPSRTDQE